MSRMRDVTVDPEAKLAHVGPGCLLKDVDRATQEHGLATVLGFISEVGVAGLTLGGGLGYLTRRFGWTVDNLEEVEIVTADGEIRTASRDENADLFWALAGRRRQLRRRHPVHVPPARGRPDRLRRADRLAVRAGRRDPARLPDDHRRGAPGAGRVADPPPRPAGAVRARGVARQADLRHGRLLQRRPGRRRRGARADPGARRPGRGPARASSRTPRCSRTSTTTEPKGRHYYWKTEYLAELSDELPVDHAGPVRRVPHPGRGAGLPPSRRARSTSATRTTGPSGTGTPAS